MGEILVEKGVERRFKEWMPELAPASQLPQGNAFQMWELACLR